MIAHLVSSLFAVCLLGGGLPAADPPRTCVVSGKVRLRKSHQTADPRGVVVFVQTVPQFFWKRAPQQSTIRQQQKHFVPNLVALVAGDSIEFVNDDAQTHNVFSRIPRDTRFDLGDSKTHSTGVRSFLEPGWTHVQCNIHEEMKADVLTLQNPFFARVSETGEFTLPALPAGYGYDVRAEEPNHGLDVRFVDACAGPKSIRFFVDALPEPAPKRKDDSNYPIYTGSI